MSEYVNKQELIDLIVNEIEDKQISKNYIDYINSIQSFTEQDLLDKLASNAIKEIDERINQRNQSRF